MFTWIKLALALMQVAKALIDRAQANQLMSAGEDRAVARQLTAMAANLKTIREIEDRFAQLPHEEVIKELDQDFRD